MINDTIRDRSAAITAYEQFKRDHHNTENDCTSQGITFIPMVIEAAGGGWAPSAERVLSELAKNKTTVSGELRNTTLSHFHQTLGLTLHRENARSILRRSSICAMDPGDLAAAAILQTPP